MLSRISLISKSQTHKQLLFSTKSSQLKSQLLLVRSSRSMTTTDTTKTEETSAGIQEQQQQEKKTVSQSQQVAKEEDYNLNEETTSTPQGEKRSHQQQPGQQREQRPPRRDNKQQYQQKKGHEAQAAAGSQLFRKRGDDQSQLEGGEQTYSYQARQEIDPVEYLMRSKTFQLQQELYALIKDKIGTKDQSKIDMFYTKLNKLQEETNLKIEDYTMRQIEALLKEKQELDDKKLRETLAGEEQEYETSLGKAYNAQALAGSSYMPARQDIDSTKVAPMTYDEYMTSVQQELIYELDRESFPEDSGITMETLANDEVITAHQDSENFDIMTEYIEGEKDKLQSVTIEGEKSEFHFDRVSQDISGFQDKYEAVKQAEALATCRAYEPTEFFDNPLDPKAEMIAEEEFDQIYRETLRELQINFREDLRNQYEQARQLMKLNQQLRNKLLTQLKFAKNSLAVTLKQKEKLVSRIEIASKDHSAEVLPNKVFDFIRQEKDISRRSKIHEHAKERNFSRDTKDVEAYNNELALLLKLYQQNSRKAESKQKYLSMMQTVVELLNKNQVTPNTQTQARLFEYGVVANNMDYSNRQIKQLYNESEQNHVNTDYLKKFFTSSLKTDNFNGLGYLVSYCEKFNLPIGEWPLERFRSALDYYLNTVPNLNNVLIFTKFYLHYTNSRLERFLQQEKDFKNLSEQQKFNLAQQVFNQQSLVDMRSLFSHLVQKVGTKEAIDPLTKQDSHYRILEFHSRPVVQELLSLTDSNLSSKDVALYFKHHLDGAKTFDKMTQVVMRSQDGQVVSELLQVLREHQANKGTLPFSFDNVKLRSAYVKVKAAHKESGVQVGEKSLEYFLFLFKSNKMWAEIIDLCENYEHLTGSNNNEIKKYYLSDALLKIPSNQHYHKLLQQAVFTQEKDTSVQPNALEITALTKAFLKDGSVDHALQYFQSSVQKLQEIKQKRERFLISMYDQVFTSQDGSNTKLSYEQFREKYLDTLALSNRALKETYVVEQIRRLVEGKDYEQIEMLFQMYTVVKEENHLLQGISKVPLSQFETLKFLEADELPGLSSQDQDRLRALRARRTAIAQKLDSDLAEQIQSLIETMPDQKIQLLNEVDSVSAKEVQKIFGLMNKEQIQEMLKKTTPYQKAIHNLRDQYTTVFNELDNRQMQSLDALFKDGLSEVIHSREYPDRGIDQALESMFRQRRPPSQEQREANQHLTDLYYQHQLDSPIVDPEDPVNQMRDTYNRSLVDMKEELLEAIDKRRKKVLTLSLEIYNKLQDQSLKMFKLSDVQRASENEVKNPQEVAQQLQKFELLLNDPRSPVVSAVQTMAQYRGDKDVKPFNQIYQDLDDFVNNRIDLEHFRRERENLENLNNEMAKVQNQLKTLNNHLVKEVQNISTQTHLYEKAQDRWTDKKHQDIEHKLESRIKQLYSEYEKTLTKNDSHGSANLSLELTDAQKLQLLRDVFVLEYGASFTASETLFPAFYSQDLIVFGLENNIPEAIRLGEHMMSQNGQKISQELAMAVKNYLFTHQKQYNDAVRRTGPIDNASLYRTQKSSEPSAIFSWDDPYWQELIEKNVYKRETQWRVPSAMAWDHKPHGIVGEVVDFDKLENNLKQAQNMRILF